ncbi:hypothetical protein H1C71_030064, partial [Ictidomys tridecemlineatus]
GISHITGIPYNPKGQGIVERAHQTIKMYLLKQKDGIGKGYIFPKDKLKITLFTLNYLNLDSSGLSAVERHMCPKNVHKHKALWKDILTGQWKGPDPVIVWSRGSVCVFPQGEQQPIWIPERLTKAISTDQKEDDLAQIHNR